MSLFAALILTAGAATTPADRAPVPATSWQRFAAAAHAMGIPTLHLHAALATKPTAAKTRTVRYCFEDRLTDPDAPRRVCRTRADWQTFGLDPIIE